MTNLRAELTEHVGGSPTAVQRALIERAVWLFLRLAQLDRKIADGKNFTEVDSNTYLAWNNSYCRTLARLGVEPKSNGGSTRARILAEIDDAAPAQHSCLPPSPMTSSCAWRGSFARRRLPPW